MNPYCIVEEFEKCIAKYANANYGVAVDSCTNALFLSLQYRLACGKKNEPVEVPKHTYPSVPMMVLHCGYKLRFVDEQWSGHYQLSPYLIWDASKRFTRGMYLGGDDLYCLSFHFKKHLAIGKGGMILTNCEKAAAWLKKARYEGREGKPLKDERIEMLGWNMYMQPEQAARGLLLMTDMPRYNCNLEEDYFDLTEYPIFQTHPGVVK